MKYLIASDLHGSLRHGQMLARAYERERADCLLLLGDLLAGAVSREEILAVCQLLNDMAGQIMAVRGNCDSESTQDWLDFPLLAERRLLYEQGRVIFATHGHLWSESSPPGQLREGDLLLTGHTHVPRLARHSCFTYLNPGSVARPRGGSRAGYLLYENGLFTWKTLEGLAFNSFCWQRGS